MKDLDWSDVVADGERMAEEAEAAVTLAKLVTIMDAYKVGTATAIETINEVWSHIREEWLSDQVNAYIDNEAIADGIDAL